VLRKRRETCRHLTKDSTTFLSYQDFEKRFGIQSHFLAFQGLISALKSLKQLNKDFSPIKNKKCEDSREQFLKTEKGNKVVYQRLVRIKKNSALPEVKKNGLMTASSRTTSQLAGSRLTDFLSIVPN